MGAAFLVSFLASVAGAVCGIGGGVIIKPLFDLCQLADVSAASFLSGCTVLCMSCYSVARSLLGGDHTVDLEAGTPLALGAAVGGIAGKQLFSLIRDASPAPGLAGGIQAACLAAITAGTLLYTLKKAHIRTRRLRGAFPCAAAGLALGVMSSFLGIGGGPVNLVVLHYFFGMQAKTAAANSLYIILFSQSASLLATLLTHTVPAFAWQMLLLMAVGGIGGGVAGRAVGRRLDDRAVDVLFLWLMVVIIAASVYNCWRFFAA